MRTQPSNFYRNEASEPQEYCIFSVPPRRVVNTAYSSHVFIYSFSSLSPWPFTPYLLTKQVILCIYVKILLGQFIGQIGFRHDRFFIFFYREIFFVCA